MYMNELEGVLASTQSRGGLDIRKSEAPRSHHIGLLPGWLHTLPGPKNLQPYFTLPSTSHSLGYIFKASQPVYVFLRGHAEDRGPLASRGRAEEPDTSSSPCAAPDITVAAPRARAGKHALLFSHDA